MEQVVDLHIAAQHDTSCYRIVMQTYDIPYNQTCLSRPCAELGWSDEAIVAMCATRKQPRNIFSTHDTQRKSQWSTVQRGKKCVSTRLQKLLHGLDDRRRIRHVFEHFHAGNQIKARR